MDTELEVCPKCGHSIEHHSKDYPTGCNEKLSTNPNIWCVCRETKKTIALQRKLEITMKALNDIEEFRRSGHFGLNFDIWMIICKVREEIEKIK